MTQVGRISGPLLEANLERNSIDLAFRNDLDTVQLLYLDVNSGRIAINKGTAAATLDVSDTSVRTVNLIADTAPVANYTISANNIDVSTGNIFLNASEAIVLSNLETAEFFVSDNSISTVNSNTNIELRPNGTGTLEVINDLKVYSNLYASGNITLDGTITFGDTLIQDTVTFNADINSDILPADSDLYKLGKIDKRWNELFTLKVNGENITTASADIGGIDLVKRTEYTVYVASNGNDANAGDHAQGPLATIQEAIARIPTDTSNFYTIHVFPGTYQEQLPIVVPKFVTIAGNDIRNTIVKPADGNNTKDVFHLSGDSTVQNLTVKDFYYDEDNNTGYAFRFVPNTTITARSPYVQNVSVITAEAESIGDGQPADIYVDLLGLAGSYSSNSVAVDQINYTQSLVESWIGKLLVTYNGETVPVTFYEIVDVIDEPLDPGFVWRIVLDRDLEDPGEGVYQFSIYPNTGETIIVGLESAALPYDFAISFNKTSLPVNFNTTVGEYWTCQIGEGLNIVDFVEEDPINSDWWKVHFKAVTTPTNGLPIFTSPSSSTNSAIVPAGKGAWIDGSEVDEDSREASMLFHSCTFITPNSDAITMTNGVRVEWLNSFTYFANRGLYAVDGATGRTSQDGSTTKYGAEIRSIGSASVYGNYGAVADGSDTLMYLIQHNFGYIGSGTDRSNDKTLAIQENEVVELNGGKVYYQSADHKGDFRVGDNFYVDFDNGSTSINIDLLAANAVTGIIIKTDDNETVISGDKVETGNIRFAANRLDSLIGDLNLVSASTVTNFADNTTIRKDLRIRDNFTFGGSLNFKGNDLSDRLKFNVELDQNFNPNQTLQFSLGSTEKFWVNAYLTTLELPNLSVVGNVITATNSNSDIELRANGVGNILIPANNVTVSNKLTVSKSTSFKNIDITGNITHIGNAVHTGNYAIAGEFTNGNILIEDNFIATTSSNSDLELRANGTGNILIPNNNVVVENNLTVNQQVTINNANITDDLSLVGDIETTDYVANDDSFIIGQNLTVGAAAQFEEILVDDNFITTTTSNTNLELRANGTGIILVPNDNVEIAENLSTRDLLINSSITVLNDIEFSSSTVSNFKLEQNTILVQGNDLELKANGTGKIVFSSSQVEIDNNFTISDTTTLVDSFIAQGFGPELAVNGTFNTDIANWVPAGGGSLQWDPQGYLIVNGTAGAQLASQNIPVVPGRQYAVTATLIRKDNEQPNSEYQLRIFQSGVGDLAAFFKPGVLETLGPEPIVLTATVTAVTSTLSLIFRALNVAVVWDNVSVTESLGLTEFFNPLDLEITGSLNQLGNKIQTGNIQLTGQATVNGLTEITNFSSTNYDISGNVLRNKETGLILNRSDPQNPLGFYGIVVAMFNGATADDYPNQTEKNLINFLANGTVPPYNLSYIDTNQNGIVTTGDTISWLQYIANGTTNNTVIDTFLKTVTDEVIVLEYLTPGTFNDTLFIGNYTDPNIDLRASGTGTVYFSNNDVDIANDVSAENIATNNLIISQRLTSDVLEITQGGVEVYDNVVTTNVSNEDLELISTRDISISSNNVELSQDLSVAGITDLTSLIANGNISLIGNTLQQGNLNIVGNLTINSLTANSAIQFDEISINDNIISTTSSNSNLELTANGTGVISVDNNLLVNNSLQAQSILATNVLANQLIEFNSATISNNLKIFNNVIETTALNSDIELQKSVGRSVRLENLRFNNSTISNNTGNIELYTDNLKLQSTDSLLLPVGTTLQRPLISSGIRFNTTDTIFEGRTNTNVSFGGVYSGDRRTSVLADTNSNTVNITVNTVPVGLVSATGLTIHGVQAGQVSIQNNIVRSTTANSNLVLETEGTGELVIGSISFSGNTIKNNNAGPLILEAERYGIVRLGTGGAAVVPSGTTAQRPVSPEVGTTRWNTDTEILETWDGNTFLASVGAAEVISEQEFSDILLEYTLIFG